MRNLIVTAICFVISLQSSLGQQRNSDIVKKRITHSFSEKTHTRDVVNDTLYPGTLDSSAAFFFPPPAGGEGCGDDVFLFSGPGGEGYPTGNNPYGDSEKLQKYGVNGKGSISEILVYFAYATGNTDSINGLLYNINSTTRGPGSVSYKTPPVPVSQIADDVYYQTLSSLPFDTEVPVEDSFFVGFTLPQIIDTVACGSTDADCYSGKQLAWEKQADNSFHPFNDGTSNSWGLNIDLCIFPVFHPDSLLTGGINFRGLTLNAAYPNPAASRINLNYSIDKSSDVRVEFYDVLGRLVKTIELGTQAAGRYSEDIDVNDLGVGNYYYSVHTRFSQLFGKVAISKP